MTADARFDPAADQPARLFDVAGQVVVVTGGGSGLGRAMAEVMAANGARVMLADVDEQRLSDVAGRLRDALADVEIETCVTDVADIESVDALFDATVQRFGRVDVTFANAGIGGGRSTGSWSGSLLRYPRKDWDSVLSINLTGVFHTLAASARVMTAQRSGSIIVTASTAGLRSEPMVGYAYASSKAGVINLVRQASIELAQYGVRVNAIAPGPFVTNIGGSQPGPADVLEKFRQTLPLQRIGDPQELKGAALLLLASPAGSFVTGAVWTVDGGAMALNQGWMRDVGPDPEAAGE